MNDANHVTALAVGHKSRFITEDELRAAAKRYCEDNGFDNVEDAMKDIYEKQDLLEKEASLADLRNALVGSLRNSSPREETGLSEGALSQVHHPSWDDPKVPFEEAEQQFRRNLAAKGYVKSVGDGFGNHYLLRKGTDPAKAESWHLWDHELSGEIHPIQEDWLQIAQDMEKDPMNVEELKSDLLEKRATLHADITAELQKRAGCKDPSSPRRTNRAAMAKRNTSPDLSKGTFGTKSATAPSTHPAAQMARTPNTSLEKESQEAPGNLIGRIDAAVALLAKEAGGKVESFKRLGGGILDMFTSSAPSAKKSLAVETAIPLGFATAEAGRGEYFRRKGNKTQDALLTKAKKDLINPEYKYTEEHFTDAQQETPLTSAGRQLKGILSGRGYTGHRDFSPVRAAIQSALVGATTSPKYTRSIMKLPGRKAIKNAQETLSPADYATWANKNVPDWMMRASGGVLSSALIHQSPNIAPAIGGVLSGAESMGEAGKNLEAATKGSKDLLTTLQGTAGEIEKATNQISELASPENVKSTVRAGAGELLDGIVQGAKRTGTKASDWIKANPGTAGGVAAGTVGAYALYKYMQNRSEDAKLKRQAELQAGAMAKALRNAR